MPALTPFCSLLDGSLHKHLICKVSVPHHGDPCQGRHPASPPAGAGLIAWGAEAPAECWRGRAASCSHPRHPTLGAWMALVRACDPGLSLGPQVQCIATLQVGSVQAGNASECGQCFSLSWMPSKPHHHLAAGFYDGESLSMPCSSTRGAALTLAETLEPCAQLQLLLEPLPSPGSGEGISGLAVVILMYLQSGRWWSLSVALGLPTTVNC